MNEKLQVYDTKMQKTLHSLDAELATIRAGRANPHILDKLTVDYYGSATPIQQVANISAPEARICLLYTSGSDRGRGKRGGRMDEESAFRISGDISGRLQL